MQVKVACTQDVLNVMEIGQRNRSVAETKMNERSSRSHSVLTIIVDGLNNVTGIRTHGCLHLIDLAGKTSRFCCMLLHAQQIAYCCVTTAAHYACLYHRPTALCPPCSSSTDLESHGVAT